MNDRIIDITETGLFLKSENKLLVIEERGERKASLPFCEIATLVISNPAVTITNSAASGISEAGGIVIFCDNKHLPTGMILPLQTHSVQTERIKVQIDASIPDMKQAWKQIVRRKIFNQGQLLLKIHGSDFGFTEISRTVKSGDSSNKEAFASLRYWRNIFNNQKFHRDKDADDQNKLLNYGYAVLHAMAARAICASGLHPGIGISHHNKYNPFCLASDIMEPFRPIVDKSVYEIFLGNPKISLNKETKSILIRALMEKVIISGEAFTVFFALSRLSSSLIKLFLKEDKELALPEDIFPIFV